MGFARADLWLFGGHSTPEGKVALVKFEIAVDVLA